MPRGRTEGSGGPHHVVPGGDLVSSERCEHCAAPLLGEEMYCTECGGVLARNVPTGMEPAAPTPVLLVYLPGRIVRQEPLLGSVVRVGRSDKSDIVIDHPRVSRQHCLFELHEGRWWVSDCRSSGGTFLNDRPVHDPQVVEGGDTCRLGRIEGECPKLVFREEPDKP